MVWVENGMLTSDETSVYQKTKNGFIIAYNSDDEWSATKYVITRKSDSIKIVETEDGETSTYETTYVISFAKNYLKAEVIKKVTPKEGNATTTTSNFEWRKSGNKEYIQSYIDNGETKTVLKAQYTVKTEKNVEATKAFDTKLTYDKVTITAYDIKSEEVKSAPASLKSAKLATFLVAGEGVTSWKAA